MTIRRRIERLEAKRSKGAAAGPSVIFLCDAVTGEPSCAIIIGGGSMARKPGETAEAFKARATAGASVAITLPDNGRAAPAGTKQAAP